MKTPVMNGMELNTVEDVFEALTEHAGCECPGTGALDGLCGAVIGFSHDNRVVYDYEKILENYMERDKMTREEAEEFVEYNTMRVLPYMHVQPVILFPLDGYKEDMGNDKG